MEVFKIVIGGFLAIPIAYLLVLWVFKQDPLQVAPKISESAPFLIPPQFRSADAEADGAKTDALNESKGVNENSGDEVKVINDLNELPKPTLDPTKIGIK